MEKALSLSQVGFDPRWPHPRNSKTGVVVGHNAYRVIVRQSSEGKGSVALYEYPIRSGIFYVKQSAPDGAVYMVLDESSSREGLALKARAEKEASKSALEKADAAFKHAEADLKRAQDEHKRDQAAQAKAAAAAAKKES